MALTTLTDGVVITAAQLNAYPTALTTLSNARLGGAPPRAVPPRVKLRIANAQTISNGTNTVLNWDTIDDNTDNMFVQSVPGQVTIRTPGSYDVLLETSMGGIGATGAEVIWICKNGTSTTANAVATDEIKTFQTQEPPISGAAYLTGPRMRAHVLLPACVAGDTIAAITFNNSGIQSSVFYFHPALPRLTVTRIGP